MPFEKGYSKIEHCEPNEKGESNMKKAAKKAAPKKAAPKKAAKKAK